MLTSCCYQAVRIHNVAPVAAREERCQVLPERGVALPRAILEQELGIIRSAPASEPIRRCRMDYVHWEQCRAGLAHGEVNDGGPNLARCILAELRGLLEVRLR